MLRRLVLLCILPLALVTSAFAQNEPTQGNTGTPKQIETSILLTGRSPLEGATVANLSPKGVVIVDVADGSPAQSVGFERGDFIISVNEKITSAEDLDRITKSNSQIWHVAIDRGRQEISVTFTDNTGPSGSSSSPAQPAVPPAAATSASARDCNICEKIDEYAKSAYSSGVQVNETYRGEPENDFARDSAIAGLLADYLVLKKCNLDNGNDLLTKLGEEIESLTTDLPEIDKQSISLLAKERTGQSISSIDYQIKVQGVKQASQCKQVFDSDTIRFNPPKPPVFEPSQTAANATPEQRGDIEALMRGVIPADAVCQRTPNARLCEYSPDAEFGLKIKLNVYNRGEVQFDITYPDTNTGDRLPIPARSFDLNINAEKITRALGAMKPLLEQGKYGLDRLQIDQCLQLPLPETDRPPNQFQVENKDWTLSCRKGPEGYFRYPQVNPASIGRGRGNGYVGIHVDVRAIPAPPRNRF